MSIIARVSDLSPFGPILGKELRITSRRRRNHLLRVCYLGGLLLFLLAVYNTMSPGRYGGGVAYRIQQQGELGQAFFATFSIFCVICMGLISPILTSTAINSERLGNTLSVLLMTPITSWQIVSGKLFSRMLIALMLIGLSLPVLAVVRLLGGVELWQMIAVVSLCTAFALSSAAIGLFYSSLINRSYAVILFAYATHFCIYFLAPMLATIVIESQMRGMSWWYIHTLLASNPVINVVYICVPRTGLIGLSGNSAWLPGVCVQLGLTLVLLIATSFIVRRHERHRGQRAKVRPAPININSSSEPVEISEADAEAARLSSQIDRALTPVGESVVGNNPVLWRELRRPLITRRWGSIFGLLVVLVLAITYGCFSATGGDALADNDLQIGYAVVFHGLFWLLVAVLSATAIAQEKESDTWTLLLTAPLSAKRIVIGKFLGITRRLIWPFALIAIHFAIFTATSVITIYQYALILWVILTFNAIWLTTGLYLSLRMRKVTTAVIINLLIPVVLYIAVPTAALAIGEMTSRSERLFESTGLYIPYVYLVTGVDLKGLAYSPGRSIYFASLRMISAELFLNLAFVVGVIHLLLAGCVMGITIRQFNRMVGRADQVAPLGKSVKV